MAQESVRAQALAQQLPSGNSPRSDFTPADIQMYYREAVAAAVDAANDLVTKAGCQDLDGFYSYMEQNRRGDLNQIRRAFAEGNAQPLVRAAQQYVASHGSGAHGPMTLAQAVAGGHVRISKDEEE
jgi:hypothetical protein